ncbi:MAG TPA: peptidoglycan-binding domain-containing protein [Lacunisphaera sp.]|nr:peptidoglycan-binding domain-containing protein [Lacunisphaera sp.]
MSKQHRIEQGECVANVAELNGFFPKTVWDHPDNAALKKKRGDPYSLLPGDMLAIPDKRLKEVAGTPEKRHRFTRKGVPEKLRVRFCVGQKPRANARYKLEVDGQLIHGTTDRDGWLECAISPNAHSARIYFDDSRDPIVLDLGHLDPIEEISGIQGRLTNLGFYRGPMDGILGPDLEAALVDFQVAKKIEVTGRPDDATKKALLEAYGK